MGIAMPVYKYEEIEKRKQNKNLSDKDNREINLKSEINNILKKDLKIDKDVVAKMKIDKITISQRTIGRTLKQIIDVRFNEIEAVKLIKKRLHFLNKLNIDYSIQDYVHPQMLDQYQFLESIALQYRQKKHCRTRIWLNRKGYEVRVQKNGEDLKWSKVSPLAPSVKEPIANIGPLSEDTIKELKDDLEERIWRIHKTNERIAESARYRQSRTDTDVEESDADDNDADNTIEENNMEN